MQIIRSLLWIGPGENLSRAGISEAPELDVTWVPSIEDAFTLPAVSFDGIVLDGVDGEKLTPGIRPD